MKSISLEERYPVCPQAAIQHDIKHWSFKVVGKDGNKQHIDDGLTAVDIMIVRQTNFLLKDKT